MTFFDWWGFLGTGIQSIFAWITFNRDGFADNVTWRQAQKYQQKNYNISWIAIARDDIRDMMGISIHRINNYMIVATLILSVAAGALISVSFSPECPGFIVFAFYLCTGTSIIFLMESIMFGVKGQNSAFTNTMKLLTYQVRPENPAEYSHDYMKQAQWVERNGLGALFRIPGILPSYNTDGDADKARTLKDYVDEITEGHGSGGPGKSKRSKLSKGRQLGSKAPEDEDVNLEEATPLESLVMRTSHTWYLSKFAEFMRLWLPYDTYSKYSMGLGILCLGHSSAYFALGYLSVKDYWLTKYAAFIITMAFIMMVGLIIYSNFRAPSTRVRMVTVALICLGPTCSTFAAIVASEVAKRILVPVSFTAHFFLWVLVYAFARDLHDTAMHFIRPGEGFWSKSAPGEKKCDDLEHGNSHLRWKHQEEQYHKEWLRHQPGYRDQTRTLSSHQMEKMDRQLERMDYIEQSPCARNSLRALSCGACEVPGDRGDRSGHSGCGDTGAEAFEDLQGQPPEEPRKSKPDFIGWPTDEDEFAVHAEHTKSHIKSTAHSTICLSALLWLAMLIWAIMTYWLAPSEVPKYATLSQEQPMVVWPTATFCPRFIACKQGVTFASDGYQIFQIDLAGGTAKRVNCIGLRGPISDLSVSCTPKGCVPVALAHSVVHCGQGPTAVQDTLHHFTVYGRGSFQEQRMLSASSSELVSYGWSGDEWQGLAFLGHSRFLSDLGGIHNRKLRSNEGLITLDELPSGDFLFVRRVPMSKPSVQIRNASDMTVNGQWHLPARLPEVQSACAFDSNSMLVLLSSGAEADGQRSLHRLQLTT